jgi:hypothetical protein
LKIFIAPETGYKDRHFVDIMGCENTKQYPTILATYQLFTILTAWLTGSWGFLSLHKITREYHNTHN